MRTSRLILEAVAKAGRGHIGSALSCVDILEAIFSIKGDSKLILSKGHAGVALYALISSEEDLMQLNQGGRLGEHPERHMGADCDTGSLGNGLGIACGMALAGNKVFVVMGDGECQEGSVWEAAMFAAQHGLNITVVIDRNGLQVGGCTEDINGVEGLQEKWEAFGWCVRECDGHDQPALISAMQELYRPLVVIARTIKGKGVSFMENRPEWHHGSLSAEQLQQARAELGP